MVVLYLCGDVMTGRGIDQVLPRPCDPSLHEAHARDARDYVALAEREHGQIGAPLSPAAVWGDALAVLAERRPQVRIANLETSITRSDGHWPGKAVHYRMSPENAVCLAAAGLDVCCLANNHVLDWGRAGLADTLAALDRLGIRRAGAGATLQEASAPAVVPLRSGRVLVFAGATIDCGVPLAWAAEADGAGVNLLSDAPGANVQRIADRVAAARRPGDIVVFSLHWGPNWNRSISAAERRLAHSLIDEAGVDLVHGHSSHHARAIEVHRGRLILYGCGDLLTDYEGIQGYEEYRGDIGVMYFPVLSPGGQLARLDMIPTRMRRFRITRADPDDARWLAETLAREGHRLGTAVEPDEGGGLRLRW